MPVTYVPISISDAATYTVLAENSGLTHIIPNLTADIVITLPTAVAGLEYTFIYGGVAADAQDWSIQTGSDTNFYLGGVHHSDVDGGTQAAVSGNGSDDANLSVLTPEEGTRIHLVCDGTNWILSGTVASVTVPAFS
ncbi:MAG: hypothetical protein GY727_14995 [Gammaproteobacteria bacterium]|nr:hypothetical protein [Gammaproteobacteria bacterium]MCP4275830.1 hypothetical protein [Gammaproteobacteria bacterium]